MTSKTQREMLIIGVDKFVEYCITNLPNTKLTQDIQQIKRLPIESISLWLKQNICNYSTEVAYNQIIAQYKLPKEIISKLDTNKLMNFIIYFKGVLE